MVSPLTTVLCLFITGMVLVMCFGICLLIKNLCRSSSEPGKIKTAKYKRKGFFKQATCSNEMCAVCLEEFEVSENINVCPCTHGYHAQCLHNWLQVKNMCPICQSDLLFAQGENMPLLRVYTIDV
ncbi:RING finger protein 24-like [Rhopilema esculentum]|uniref:RING finger protein 24-like n=1 Tax=Rhopilema esculentum TaxID=499914 RepID=UPI0031D96AB1